MSCAKRFTVLLFLSSLPLLAADLTLKPATLRAWNAYLNHAEDKVVSERPLRLSIERSSIVKVDPAVATGITPVPNGLIHDWLGTTFVPNVTLAQLQAVLHDYDHYKEIYRPAVIDSRAMVTGDKTETFSMEWFHKVFNITTGIDADYASTQISGRSESGYIVTRSTRVQEIRDWGRENEQKLPPDTGSGYIWRLCSILRYQEADGGVYLQLEAIVLTREIPRAVRWVANPIVSHLSRNSVAATLTQTSEAVHTRSAKLTGDALAQAR